MPRGKKKNYLIKVYRRIIFTFIFLVLVIIGVLIYISSIQAKILVTPKRNLQNVEFLTEVGKAEKAIPGSLLERLVEKEMAFEATGEKKVQDKASGEVIIYNQSDFPQALVATTRLLSSQGILFRLKNAVNVPAHGQIKALVYADEPGESGNINPDRFTIPGLSEAKRSLIYAESKQPMVGGIKIVRYITQEDLAKAQNLFLQNIEEEALKIVKGEIKEKDFDVLSKPLSFEVKIDAKANEEKNNFTVKGKMDILFVIFDRSKLEAQARERFISLLPNDRELINFNAKQMDIKIQSFDLNEGKAVLRVYADGETILKKESEILNVEKLAGMRLEDAKRYLESFDSIDKVEIKVFPKWLKTLPTLADHLEIEIVK